MHSSGFTSKCCSAARSFSSYGLIDILLDFFANRSDGGCDKYVGVVEVTAKSYRVQRARASPRLFVVCSACLLLRPMSFVMKFFE